MVTVAEMELESEVVVINSNALDVIVVVEVLL
jgi:hypothetical protein